MCFCSFSFQIPSHLINENYVIIFLFPFSLEENRQIGDITHELCTGLGSK